MVGVKKVAEEEELLNLGEEKKVEEVEVGVVNAGVGCIASIETKDNTLVELGEQLAVAVVEEGTKNPAEAGVADTDETGVVVAAEHDSSAE